MEVLEGPSLVIIDNPNNPTGRMLLDPLAVEALLQQENVLVVIDEAYYCPRDPRIQPHSR